jgi:hypothetical protein
MIATRDDLHALLVREGLPWPDLVGRLAVPCLMLSTTRAHREPSLGEGRIGGFPDLPVGAVWPHSRAGRPLTFLGQLALETLANAHVAGELPDQGLLGWYVDLDGSGPPDFAMTLTPRGVALERLAPPGSVGVLSACSITMEPAWSLPQGGYECPFFAALDLGADEREAWDDFLSMWATDHMPEGHQLLGYASAFNDPYIGAALDLDEVLRETWFARPPAGRTRLTDELADAARAMRLCIELNEDEAADLDFGDGTHVSFLLRRDAWSRGRFAQHPPTSEASIWLEHT